MVCIFAICVHTYRWTVASQMPKPPLGVAHPHQLQMLLLAHQKHCSQTHHDHESHQVEWVPVVAMAGHQGIPNVQRDRSL